MNSLIVQLNQDKAGDEDAHCFVLVDGVQVGDRLTVRTARGDGVDDFELRGDWHTGTQGSHQLQIHFLNDFKRGEEDRNLYLQHAFINGEPIKITNAPIRLSKIGPCDPIGFAIPFPRYSIPAAFQQISEQVEQVRQITVATLGLVEQIAARLPSPAPAPAPAGKSDPAAVPASPSPAPVPDPAAVPGRAPAAA